MQQERVPGKGQYLKCYTLKKSRNFRTKHWNYVIRVHVAVAIDSPISRPSRPASQARGVSESQLQSRRAILCVVVEFWTVDGGGEDRYRAAGGAFPSSPFALPAAVEAADAAAQLLLLPIVLSGYHPPSERRRRSSVARFAADPLNSLFPVAAAADAKPLPLLSF
ncbi:hypothetical protein L596_020359 [Steinernema carpocapsae]|uniref:Uncharacterized protein n=1 Tax=Steinernema carpocapsae TaxID=34508 RepID=A0A4V6A0V6_STECR|nr:hypothetical protein L596_020359 [Steinernema carpocapsae]